MTEFGDAVRLSPKIQPVHLAWSRSYDCLVNLAGDYSYLTGGYYASQDVDERQTEIHPTCKEVMDAYIMPIFLEQARRSGLEVPHWYISNGYLEPPVIVDTINPFMARHSVLLKAAAEQRIAKSLTRNFTYAVCCQELPPRSRIIYFRSLLGWTASTRFQALAAKLWETFHIPAARVRVVVTADGQVLVSGLHPLPMNKLSERERAYLKKEVRWRI